jgi:hypothetical protein
MVPNMAPLLIGFAALEFAMTNRNNFIQRLL